MSAERIEQLPAEIEKLYRDFVRRGWLKPAPDRRLERTQADFFELDLMLKNMLLLVTHAFGTTEQEKKDIFYESSLGRLIIDLIGEIRNLSTPVKSLILQPVSTPKPRNTSHPDKEAVTRTVLNACATLMPHHKSKVACFREVSELLKKHDTFLKHESIAKLWYAREQAVRKHGLEEGVIFYADHYIAFGDQTSPAHRQLTHSEVTKEVMFVLSGVLPDISADLRNAA